MAILHWAESRIEDAEREAIAAVAALETLPPGSKLALAYGALSRLRATTLDATEAVALGERAISLASRHHAQQVLVGALITVGVTRHAEGEERGREQLEQALALASAHGFSTLVARATFDLGVGFSQQYRYASAIPYYEARIAYSAEHDFDHSRLYATSWLAHAHYFLGHWDDATRLAASVLDSADVPPITRFTALYVRGMIRVRRGDPDSAPYLDEALTHALGSGSLARLGPIRAARAEAAWMNGDFARSVSEARAAYDLATDRRQRWYLGELAYWRWRGADLAPPTPPVAEPFALQITGDWLAAASAWDALGCPYEASRARADAPEEKPLRQALVAFERLEAGPAIARTRRRLRKIGAHSVPRGPRPSTRTNLAQLTRREVEIVTLIADDRSNQEIADRLFLSPRTVENHVAAILSKLGVAARADAARDAERLGLSPQTK